MVALRYTADARGDLRDIGQYTRQTWGRAQAIRYVRDLRAACRLLAENPFLGAACDEVFPGLRRLAKGSHVLYYRRTHNGIAITRILHQRMVPHLRLPSAE